MGPAGHPVARPLVPVVRGQAPPRPPFAPASTATPYVAGAAPLLKQQRLDWTFRVLKAALVSSAKGGDYTPYESRP